MKVDPDNIVLSVIAPDYFVGISYKELSRKFKEDYGLTFIAATRPDEHRNILGIRSKEARVIDLSAAPDTAVGPDDRLTLYGPATSIARLR